MESRNLTKNIIFDLAGVVLNLNLERDTEALHSVGLPDFEGCLADRSIASPLLDYLNGQISADLFVERIAPHCRPDATREEILYSMDAVLDDIPQERLATIAALSKKYRVFLLSNIYEAAWQHTLNEFSQKGYCLEDCFEKVFLSHEMQLAKPDPRIYNKVIEETGITPEETLYFDDSRANIEAAQALGFRSVLVKINKLESVIATIDNGLV